MSAPGGDFNIDSGILSTVPLTGGIIADPSGYRFLQGGSMATAYVAGLAGLILSSNGGLSNEEVRDAIRAGVDPVDSTFNIGTGRVNIRKVMESRPITLSVPGEVYEGDGRLIGQGSLGRLLPDRATETSTDTDTDQHIKIHVPLFFEYTLDLAFHFTG